MSDSRACCADLAIAWEAHLACDLQGDMQTIGTELGHARAPPKGFAAFYRRGTRLESSEPQSQHANELRATCKVGPRKGLRGPAPHLSLSSSAASWAKAHPGRGRSAASRGSPKLMGLGLRVYGKDGLGFSAGSGQARDCSGSGLTLSPSRPSLSRGRGDL